MKRFISCALAFVVIGGCLVAAFATKRASAAVDPALQADRAWVAAMEKGDHAAIAKLTDADFTWIDTDGVMWAREDAFRAGLKPLVPGGNDVKIVEHNYGKVIWIQENVGNKYAAHFWVERPSGWKLLHNSEIATRPRSENSDRMPDYAIPCVNPCQEVPFKAITPNEKAALAAWQEQEDGKPENWHKHVADDNVVVSSYGLMTKNDRWTMIQKFEQERHPKVGTSPVLWMRMWDFGTAVVAVACQPNYGGKSYWASRIFAKNKDGLWQMMESYHTTIQASPILTEPQGK
ncbi:MAG TPA: nuclear transport factor 2 family protein [Candidatus Acidoferrales bacterium]|nr:nuclear transport factor 2 family protein [Candidatus Acidoferrales bacterium]